MKYIRSIPLATLSIIFLSITNTNARFLNLPPNKNQVFLFKTRKKTEKLIVSFLDSKTIKFRILSINNATGATAALAGTARVADTITDPEIDGDEQGEAYAVDEFLFGGNCGLAIRIDAENHKLAKVYSTSCFESGQIKQHGVGFDCRKPMRIVK